MFNKKFYGIRINNANCNDKDIKNKAVYEYEKNGKCSAINNILRRMYRNRSQENSGARWGSRKKMLEEIAISRSAWWIVEEKTYVKIGWHNEA